VGSIHYRIRAEESPAAVAAAVAQRYSGPGSANARIVAFGIVRLVDARMTHALVGPMPVSRAWWVHDGSERGATHSARFA
jgi:hypothetical protein